MEEKINVMNYKCSTRLLDVKQISYPEAELKMKAHFVV